MNERNDGCKMRSEASTRSDSLYLFGQVFFNFYQGKSGKSQGILKGDACGNRVKGTCVSKV